MSKKRSVFNMDAGIHAINCIPKISIEQRNTDEYPYTLTELLSTALTIKPTIVITNNNKKIVTRISLPSTNYSEGIDIKYFVF